MEWLDRFLASGYALPVIIIAILLICVFVAIVVIAHMNRRRNGGSSTGILGDLIDLFLDLSLTTLLSGLFCFILL